ncbi:MAG: nucleotidyltransferase domain-containing protein, partial [Thermoproteales archaeon]|nr:nucleotidyltransferase domain-containing protein [Thermoproteales archaeon]
VLETVGDTDLPIEIHPYTPQEAAEMLEKANPTIVDALEEGKPLYASPTLQKLKNKLKQLKQKGLQKTHTTVKIPT